MLLLYIDVPGQFPIENEHLINEDNRILDDSITDLESAAIKFSIDAIQDANVRQSYTNNIKRIGLEIKELVNTRKISVKEAAEFCYQMRNQIMAEHRKFTSAYGLAKATQHKKAPPSLDDLLSKYAQKKICPKLQGSYIKTKKIDIL
ncbi:hypothetical protein RHO13_03955 [Orbus wheelerorum]|uniref:hypothetical protein n=1 Tax=Orbus wheelerorum TaxID=3074111 RepID=UPI00370D063A